MDESFIPSTHCTHYGAPSVGTGLDSRWKDLMTSFTGIHLYLQLFLKLQLHLSYLRKISHFFCFDHHLPVSSITDEKEAVQHTVSENGNFSIHTSTVTKSRGWCLCCPIVSHYPSPSSSGMWVLSGEPQARVRWQGRDKPTATHSLWSDEEGGRRHSSFGGLGLIASPCEGLNRPPWECGPFYTHA